LIYNHVLSSYLVALVNVVTNSNEHTVTQEHVKLIRKSLKQLAQIIEHFILPDHDEPFSEIDIKPLLTLPESNEAEWNEETKLITEQISFISKITQDLNKICKKMELLNE